MKKSNQRPDWEKEIIRITNGQIGYKRVDRLVSFIKQELEKARREALDEAIEMVGEDEDDGKYGVISADEENAFVRNRFREDIRQKLKGLKNAD